MNKEAENFSEYVRPNLMYTKKRITKVIDSITSTSADIIELKDVFISYDGSETDDIKNPGNIFLHIPLKHKVNEYLNGIFQNSNDEFGMPENGLKLYWTLDEKRYYLLIYGRELCGNRLKEIIEGKADYNSCPCVKEYNGNCKELIKYAEFCKHLTKTLKRWNIPTLS